MNREKKRKSNKEQAQRVTKVQMFRRAGEGGKKGKHLRMFLSITKKTHYGRRNGPHALDY
jgi:hypothetical protein